MSKDICKELRDVSRRSPSGISGCCLDAANEIEVLRADNEALQHDIARGAAVCAEQAGEIEKLRSALNAMLTQFGMDEDSWSKPTFDQARTALLAKEE